MKPIEPKTCQPTRRLLNSTAELEQICTKITAHGQVAVDTEFVWERTFYPNLGIVQLALNETEAWLLDMPALQGKLEPLGKVLANPKIEKIIHDAKQDLTILRQATGFYPRHIFDTRLAAGFIGPSATLSLLDSCSLFADLTLNKGETRSDWLKRPLSEKQLEYALDDVLFLPLIRDQIMDQAKTLGRSEWIKTEMQLYDNPDIYDDPDTEQVYTKVKGISRLHRRELAIICQLAAWRERKARSRNRPRRHIIPDEALVKIAQNAPRNFDSLKEKCGLSPRASQRYGEQLLQAVEKGLKTPESNYPTATKRSRNPKTAEKSRNLMEKITAIAKELNLDPALIATRKDIEKFLTSTDPKVRNSSPLMQGWRFKLLSQILQP